MNPRLVAALVLVAMLTSGALLVAASGEGDDAPPAATAFAGSLLPPDVPAPEFTLTDQDGKRIRMSDLRGEVVVVTFLYTTCEDTCPTAVHQIKGALDQLDHDVPALAIAVDPPRDTPESARRFLSKLRMTGRLDFVLGSRAELEPLWRGYAIQEQLPGAEHQARIVLVDRSGRQRIGFPLEQATPDRLANDIRLLEGERQPG